MSDIIITDGLPEAWTIANTDKLKLDDANLINLAVGELALLGASQGTTLRAQTLELKKLISSIDIVNNQLDLMGEPTAWSGSPADPGFPPASIGWVLPSTSPLSASDIALIDQMISATSKLEQANVKFEGFDAFKWTLTRNGVSQVLVSRPTIVGTYVGDISGTLNLGNIQPDNSAINVSASKEGQTFTLSDNSGATDSYAYVGGKVIKIPLIPTGNRFAIPSTTFELQNWQAQMPGNTAGLSSAQIAINSSATLSSDVVLVENNKPAPVPPVDPPPTNEVKMAINSGSGFDMAEYTLSNNLKIYAPYPPKQVSQFDNTSQAIPANIGTAFQLGQTTVMVSSDHYGNVFNVNVTSVKPFFYKPTSEQFNNWRGQFAEKIILITQRSSDQQLFVNNLAQKYQYSFDAATYVLKAFSASLSSIANNV